MSENRRIARAAGQVGALTLASRITGLLRDAVTSYYFGAGPAADAFFVAFRLPNLLRRFVGEGAMTAAFMPVFTELPRRGQAAGSGAGAARDSLPVFGLAPDRPDGAGDPARPRLVRGAGARVRGRARHAGGWPCSWRGGCSPTCC